MSSPNWVRNDLFYSNAVERPLKLTCFYLPFVLLKTLIKTKTKKKVCLVEVITLGIKKLSILSSCPLYSVKLSILTKCPLYSVPVKELFL